MDTGRKPLQGVLNIARFNWQYYALSVLITLALFIFARMGNTAFRIIANIIAILSLFFALISLFVSCYIYDFSRLYRLSWIDCYGRENDELMININAGFDETSELIKKKFSDSNLQVFDFYNADRHTEISIKRARSVYSPYPGTIRVSTDHLPLPDNYADKIFIIFSAHEIRDMEERISFFKEVHRTLKTAGQVIVTEHLRDAANFLVYNLGAFHFYSRSVWARTFQESGFEIAREIKITPFITTFFLKQHGNIS